MEDAGGRHVGNGTVSRRPRAAAVLLACLGGLALLWLAPLIASFVSAIDLSSVDHVYGIITGFVILDAIFPVFPSESLLTTASNLAAQPDSSIELWRLAVAGSVGAVVGDSLLYWLSRTVLHRFMEHRITRSRANAKVDRALRVLDTSAPLLLVFGRFVPGLRFAIGATLGLVRYPYRRFLVWSSLGGVLWATYTCVFCYLVASVIEDKPLVSIATSVVVTTALLAVLYRPLKRSWDEAPGRSGTPEVDPIR